MFKKKRIWIVSIVIDYKMLKRFYVPISVIIKLKSNVSISVFSVIHNGIIGML